VKREKNNMYARLAAVSTSHIHTYNHTHFETGQGFDNISSNLSRDKKVPGFGEIYIKRKQKPEDGKTRSN